eukprot:14685-Heterococcus_DN1.PRE.2
MEVSAQQYTRTIVLSTTCSDHIDADDSRSYTHCYVYRARLTCDVRYDTLSTSDAVLCCHCKQRCSTLSKLVANAAALFVLCDLYCCDDYRSAWVLETTVLEVGYQRARTVHSWKQQALTATVSLLLLLLLLDDDDTHYCRAVRLVNGPVQCAMTSRSCTRMQSAGGHTGMAVLLQLPLLLLLRESNRAATTVATTTVRELQRCCRKVARAAVLIVAVLAATWISGFELILLLLALQLAAALNIASVKRVGVVEIVAFCLLDKLGVHVVLAYLLCKRQQQHSLRAVVVAV